MKTTQADVAIVGAGVCGLLVARELRRAGREVLILERGGYKSHPAQLGDGEHSLDIPTARPNHDSDYPWQYVYGVGGSTLHWDGVAPRLLPTDFELRSRHGVGRDWPIRYRDLNPFYEEAERALSVAGGKSYFPRRAPYPQPAHPLSPADRLVAPMLQPYFHLPQARPTREVNGRPACCGSARCGLCPVDARYSALHTLMDEPILDSPKLRLSDRTIAARLVTEGKRVVGIECLDERGERSVVEAGTVVLAANGIENAATLLRSGLDDGDVGRWLSDHQHHFIEIRLRRSAHPGRGSSIATGLTYAYADGEWRSRRGSMLLYLYNPGRAMTDLATSELASGHGGSDMRKRLQRRFDRTLIFISIGEDLPTRERRVELSPKKDHFGLPLNRIRRPPDSNYLMRSRRLAVADLERRLRPLGAEVVSVEPSGQGAHQLGTCFMGERDGVVDPDQRHHRLENLYVAGGSSFPTYTASHPTLTIAALAVRLGRHLAGAAPGR